MKIIKNYLYNVSYQIFLILVPLITTPYVSRVLGPKGVGINAYTNSIIQYFVLFGSLGISLYGNREIAYNRENKVERTKVFIEIEILHVIAIIFVCILFIIYFAATRQYHIFLLAQAIQIIAAALDISWFFMGIENFKVTVLRNFFVKLFGLIMIFTLVKTRDDTLKYIVILSLSILFANMTLWLHLKSYLIKPLKKNIHVLRHLKPTLVLFLPQIASQIYLILNKTMLGKIKGVTAAGFFDNSDKLIRVALAVVTAIGTVMIPRMSSLYAHSEFKKIKYYLYNVFDFVTFGSIPIVFGLMAIAPQLSVWFFGPEYAKTGTVIIFEAPAILMIAWSNALGQQYLLPTNQNRYYATSVTFGSVINIVLNIPFIIWFGVIGAAITTVIAEFSIALAQLYFIRKNVDFKIMFRDLWKYLISGAIMYIIVYTVNSKIRFTSLTLLSEIIVGCLTYLGMNFILKTKTIETTKKFITKNMHK